MKERQPGAKRSLWCRFFAVICVTCGLLFSSQHIISYFDPDADLWDTVGGVEAMLPGPEVSVQPSSDEWPLMLSRLDFKINRPDLYKVEIGYIRGTDLLELRVTGSSSNRTSALAGWLTASFAQSLQHSYDKRGISRPLHSLQIEEQPEFSDLVPKRVGMFVVGLLTPLLLLTSGFLLLRTTRVREQNE